VSFVHQSEKLWNELAALADDEGLVLYDCERTGNGGLRVFISLKGSEAKVSSGDCSKLCRRLMTFFMVEGPELGLSAEPEIEVSSPGINRHLRLPEHFKGAVGERVKFGIRGEVESEGEKSKVGGLLGKIEEASQDSLVVRDERTKKAWKVQLDQISKAHVDFEFR